MEVFQLVRKFLMIFPLLSEISSIYIWKSTWTCHKTGHVMMRSYVLIIKIHFNIIISHMSSFSKWNLSFRFPHQGPVSIYPPPPLNSPHDHLIPPSFTWDNRKMSVYNYQFQSFPLCNFFTVFFGLFTLGPKTFSQNPFLKIFQTVFWS